MSIVQLSSVGSVGQVVKVDMISVHEVHVDMISNVICCWVVSSIRDVWF